MMKRKIMNILCACFLVIVVVAGAAVKGIASDKNYKFSFKVGAFWGNGQESQGRYRQTQDPDNKWKVKLLSSGEGTGTVTDFWLERSNGDNVSKTVSAIQGGAAIYSSAYNSASECKVYLTGENNNFNAISYAVSGYWDEETN